jgi:N-acetylglucosamine-6-phosphate deacetylase
MHHSYPWPDPPPHAQIVVRLHPGSPVDRDPQETLESIFSLEWSGEHFAGIRPADRDERRRVSEDPHVFATPGLFDVQINGYWGRGFKDPDLGPEGIRDLCWSIALSGSTRFLPTITTDAPATMQAAMANVDAACRLYPDVHAMVAGIHQEGPWISPHDGPRGAHPLEHVVPPDLEAWERFQEASGWRITMLTLAPEVPGALDLIWRVSEGGVVVCLGHHQADGATIRQAVEAGARSVTHLGNGCQPLMPRHPNILWQQAAEDRLYASVIADGHHLPPETVKVFYRAKPAHKLILVSDAIRMAGAPAGLYRTDAGANAPSEVAEMTPEGRYGFYGSPILLGAAMPLARCLANFAQFVQEGRSPADYVQHATKVPEKLMGQPDQHQPLGKPGTPATFVVWRWDPETPNLTPQRIVLRGRTIYDVAYLPLEVPFGRLQERVEAAETPSPAPADR